MEMKVLQDNFFKYSKSRSGGEGGLADERRRLFEEQKLSRARVRKMTMETNRRRRALQERQFEWNMQQKQMRANILLQRRQQIQDATERFQRAHLPPPQRYRQDFRKNVPNIEDALNQIQGKLSSTKQQSYLLSSNSNTTRRCTSSAKPPAAFKSSHRQTFSAVEISRNPIQELSMTPLDICQPKKSQEKKQDCSPQDNILLVSSDSDSISSKDSLEFEDPDPSTENLQSFHSSFLLGLEQPYPAPEPNEQNDLCPTTDLTSFSENILLGDNLPRSRNLQVAEKKTQENSAWSIHKLPTSKALKGFPSVEQMPKQIELSTSINNLNKLKIENPINTLSQEHACCEVSTEIEKSVNIASQETTVSTELINGKSDIIESQQHACLYNIQADTPKCPEKDVQKLPVSMETSHPILQVGFVKGILKQHPQNMAGSQMCVYGSGHFTFPEQLALAIRDSFELTKERSKKFKSNNILIKKKLRWFDEEGEDTTQDMKPQMNNVSSQCSNNSEDKQESLAMESCTGIHFTKPSTADVGVQVSPPPKRAEEVKVLCSSSNRTDGLQVPERESSAPPRAGASPVSSRIRRGTVLRPVSATEMNQIAKTHWKIIAPRPPPDKEMVDGKTAIVIKSLHHLGVDSEQAQDLEPSVHKNNAEDLVLKDTLSDSKTVSGGNKNSKANSAHRETQSCSRGSGMADGLHLDHSPTDEEISQLWQDVRSVLCTKEEKNRLGNEATDRAQIVRKPKVKQSTQPPGSRHKSFPQHSQPTRLMSEPGLRRFYRNTFPDEGLKRATQLHLAKEHAEGFSGEKDAAVAMEMQLHLATISMEEQKILLSLDELNRKLLYKGCEHPKHHKYSTSPANNCAGYKKKM